MRQDKIRNFSIIAHIDHGKSTLADRFLQKTGLVNERNIREQTLDDMDLERERGITIKASAVTLDYKAASGEMYQFNLIDTPGHVDFSYEVSRSLAACEGAILVVDASQGVEAQTVANAYLAVEHNLDIIPVLNKIDLPHARPQEAAEEIEHAIGLDATDALHVSAKTGEGVDELLAAVVERIRPPAGDPDAPLQALIFDSIYDDYRGVIVYIRVVSGRIRRGQKILMLANNLVCEVTEIGHFRLELVKCDELVAGEVGYLISNIKSVSKIKIGDTISVEGADIVPLPGYREPKPMVFCGLYPADDNEFEALKKAIERLKLNDSALTYQPESSALGLGFRCGFLGLLHMEIVQERIERESSMELIQTAPNVTYEVLTTSDQILKIESPAQVPDPSRIKEFREPVVRVQFIIPAESIGAIVKLCEDRRGRHVKMEYISSKRVTLEYDLPLAEIVYDFHGKLKSQTRGYGTMDYHLAGYAPGDLVKLDILVAGKPVDALSLICHRGEAPAMGRRFLQRLRKEIPRHLFQIALQAVIGGKVVARETISPMGKNVTAKCYGGDITRKRKLWEKQKEGKKRMKSIGQVQVPQEAFRAVLRPEEE